MLRKYNEFRVCSTLRHYSITIFIECYRHSHVIFSFILDVGISREVEVEDINNVSLEVAELDLPEISNNQFQIIQPNGVVFKLQGFDCFKINRQLEPCEDVCTETYVDCEYWQELYSLCCTETYVDCEYWQELYSL